MTLSTLDTVLWVASLLGHVTLLFVLIARVRWRQFPVFTSFVAFNVLRTIVLFLVRQHGTRHGYFLAYWITGFADYLFQIALILEIARDVLRPAGRWVLEARRVFVVWGAAGLLVAAGLALTIGPPESKGLDLWDVRITVFTSLLTCGLFLAMATAANRLGLGRRSHILALGQGLTAWAFVALLEDFGHVTLGWNRQFIVFVHLREAIYLAVLGYWIWTFWRPEAARPQLSGESDGIPVALREEVHYDHTRLNRPPL